MCEKLYEIFTAKCVTISSFNAYIRLKARALPGSTINIEERCFMRYQVFTGSGYMIVLSGGLWGFAQAWGDEWKVAVWDSGCDELPIVSWRKERPDALSLCLARVEELSTRVA
jgi:hypothetical protein